MKRLLAVASGGGHWVQLLRLAPAMANTSVTWVTTDEAYRKDVDSPLHVVRDANRSNKMALVKMFLQMAWIIWRVRPHIVLTTGAAPGFAAIVFGRILGAKTVWIDSIANAEEMSKSGAMARRWADVWLTQWQSLERPYGPAYWGTVL